MKKRLAQLLVLVLPFVLVGVMGYRHRPKLGGSVYQGKTSAEWALEIQRWEPMGNHWHHKYRHGCAWAPRMRIWDTGLERIGIHTDTASRRCFASVSMGGLKLPELPVMQSDPNRLPINP